MQSWAGIEMIASLHCMMMMMMCMAERQQYREMPFGWGAKAALSLLLLRFSNPVSGGMQPGNEGVRPSDTVNISDHQVGSSLAALMMLVGR